MKQKNFVSLLLLTILFVSSCGFSPQELTIQETWARPAFKGENGAVYFVIKNNTESDDALASVTTDIADAAEAHMSMQNDQGVVSMQMQEAVQIPAGDSVTFKPGGLHIMLVGLKQDLRVGDTFTFSLHFEKAGEITVQVEVREQ